MVAPTVAPIADRDGGIIAEVTARHGHSQQPESQQVVAVLGALQDVIATEQLPCTPTSFFAAGMSALEKPETRSSAQVVQALLTLLGMVLPRVPNGVLRAKWNSATTLLCTTLKEHSQQAGVAKAGLGVLSQMLGAMDPSPEAWPAAIAPWSLLLSTLTDSRAKVRKRGAAGVQEVLAALQPHSAALAAASDALAKLAAAFLAGPEAAARAAASASNKARGSAEEAITQAVADALHVLGALKQALPLMSGSAAKAVVDLLFKLYPLRQPLLTRHASDALAHLVSAPSTHLTPATLAELLNVVIDAGPALWDRHDSELTVQLTRLLEGGCLRLARTAPPLALAALPRITHIVVPQLAAQQEGVRHATAMALRALIKEVTDEEAVAAAVAGPAAARTLQPALASVIAAVASSLTPRYQEGWPLAITVTVELFEALGRYHSPAADGMAGTSRGASPVERVASLMAPLLRPLAAMVAGDQDASAEGAPGEASASGEVVEAAASALGSALRALGPGVVLRVLPLHIREQLAAKPGAATPEPRTWLLPLLRRHVAGATLSYWGSELLPLARGLAAQSTTAAAAGQPALAQSCHVLELQIWATLPAFMSWATDLPTAFPVYAKDMAGAFSARDDLRGWVCAALERAALQARQVLRGSTSHRTLIGFAEPLGVTGAHGDDDDDDEYDSDAYGAPPARSVASMRRAAAGRAPSAAGAAHDAPHHLQPPERYTVEVAEGAAKALRGLAKNWLSVLCKAFLAEPPESRGALARAISAYAAVSEPAVVAGLFRTAITRLLKIMADEGVDVPPPDVVTDGGDTPTARRCAFTELALCLASGLPDEALETLLKAAKPSLLEGQEAAVQKKGYKVLAYLCEARPTFLSSHLPELLGLVVGGTPHALSAAKRYRLRCLKPLILALAGATDLSPDLLPDLPGGRPADSDAAMSEEDADAASSDDDEAPGSAARRKAASARLKAGGSVADPQQRRNELISVLVSELMLCCKESNKKTRAAGYHLLVQVAHAMDELQPGGVRLGGGAPGEMDDEDAPPGGLASLLAMVMAGLAGQTPHMISATVMTLARLLYEFAGRMEPLVPDLMPPVLLLLRTRSREVVKSVLGFIKVCAMRMPSELLTAHLEPLLEGMLLWASDSKNKFRQKVRVIVERLARRCGFDAVAAHIPESDAKLLTHIRKQHNRKMRLKAGASQAGSEAGDGDDDAARSQRSGAPSSAGRTARTGQWAHTEIFSDDEGDGEGGGEDNGSDGRKALRRGAGPQQRGRAATVVASARSKAGGGAGRRPGLPGTLSEGTDDPMDLLDASASRQLVRNAAGARRVAGKAGKQEDDFVRDPEGRMMIEDEEEKARQRAAKRKRRGADGFDSDDSDFEDLRGVGGLDAAMRDTNASAAVQRALSVKAGGGPRSVSGRSTKSAGAASARGAGQKKGPSLHSGERFKARSETGGDVQGKAKVQPYAYWQFDRKMLNRRPAKKRQASKSLGGVLGDAQAGAVRGAKAKARANAVKRARSS